MNQNKLVAPRIVVLDSQTLGMDLSSLAGLGELIEYPLTSPDEAGERIKGADIVLTNKVRIAAAEMEAAASLGMIGVFATGYNNIDVDAARRRGIVVCNEAAYSDD